MSFKINLLVFVAVGIYYSQADSEENMKLNFVKYILECAEKHPVAPADIMELSKNKVVKTENVKCLLACTYKKTGMTDNEGKLSVEGIKKISEAAFADKPNLLKMSDDFVSACISVNDEEISGDNKDCERAARIFKCSVEHSSGIPV